MGIYQPLSAHDPRPAACHPAHSKPAFGVCGLSVAILLLAQPTGLRRSASPTRERTDTHFSDLGSTHVCPCSRPKSRITTTEPVRSPLQRRVHITSFGPLLVTDSECFAGCPSYISIHSSCIARQYHTVQECFCLLRLPLSVETKATSLFSFTDSPRMSSYYST